MRKSTIPELNNREDLARLYERFTCSEIADRLGCCWETVRKRLVKFGIPRRKGAVSSKQTRIEKAEMYIRQMLRPWPVETQAHILRPIVKELGSVMSGLPACPICGVFKGHEPWCSMAAKAEGRNLNPIKRRVV